MINTLVKGIICLSPASPVFKGISKDFILFLHVNFIKFCISVRNNANLLNLNVPSFQFLNVPLPEITEVAIVTILIVEHIIPSAAGLIEVVVSPLQFRDEEIDVALHV